MFYTFLQINFIELLKSSFIIIQFLDFVSVDVLPQFVGDLTNLTVAIGREAVFSCNVKNLGNYKVRRRKVLFWNTSKRIALSLSIYFVSNTYIGTLIQKDLQGGKEPTYYRLKKILIKNRCTHMYVLPNSIWKTLYKVGMCQCLNS